MGLNYNNIKFLIHAKSLGVNFGNTATIGRQGLHIKKNKLAFIFKDLKGADVDNLLSSSYSEKLLEYLGSTNVDSFDFSGYENAKIIHDFNKPISDEYKNKYDLVIDGGTLEHVFNFPVAIKNCMEMVKPGGYFVSMTTCNNFSGHGFYQFSPELFFRLFSKDNGYFVKQLLIEERNKWYIASDPALINRRVTFKNSEETTLFLIAKKELIVNIFDKTPQQSDYVVLWNENKIKNSSSFFIKVIRRLKVNLKNFLIKYDKDMFKKIEI